MSFPSYRLPTEMTMFMTGIYMSRGVTQSLRQGGHRPPISQDMEAGGRNMFVRMNLSLKYSQKRNFFEQKNKIFKSRGLTRRPRSYAPVYISVNNERRMNRRVHSIDDLRIVQMNHSI